jgi:hypothetical protein
MPRKKAPTPRHRAGGSRGSLLTPGEVSKALRFVGASVTLQWYFADSAPRVLSERFFYVGRKIRLLTLLGHPVVPLNPFLGFCFGLKFAEEVWSLVWPRDFDAPKTRLCNRR